MAYLCVRYHVNSGTITTNTSATTRYRVSSSLVQRSTDSGSTWATYYTNFNATATTNYVNLVDVATFGITRTGYKIASDATAYRAKSTTGNVINQATTSSSSANAATVARLNGSVPSSNTTINVYVNWVANTYTVTLNRNGGPANGTASVTATYASAMPSATMPTRAGYTFSGYYDSSAASGGTQYYYANGASARTWNKTAATTLYARWTKNNYNLTLNTENQYQVLPYDGKIEHWDNKIYDNLKMLAQHGDGYFASGLNDVTSYVNNSTDGNGTSTVTRAIRKSDNPFNAGLYELKVSVSKNANTAYIGFVQTTTSAASQVFVHLFVAKLPKNYYFSYASNATGDGRSFRWLTPWVGTGKYEIYAIELQCGSSGTFSTFGHIYVQPNNTAFTLDFYVAYSEIFKTTRNQTFSIPYGTLIQNLPIPVGHGTKLKGWCTNYTGNAVKVYGRDMMYTDKLSVHLVAYMADWSLYTNGASGGVQMRLISCTEGGGWNIEATDGVHICAAGYDSGVGYKNASSNVEWSSLTSGFHAFDLIFNGTNLKLYLDGELIATSDTYTSGLIGYNTLNGIFVAGEAEGNETTATSNRFVGQVANVVIQHDTNLVPASDCTKMIMPAADTTITPWWADEEEFSIHLNSEGGLNTTSLITDTYKSVVEVPTPIKIGHTFKGWYYDLNSYNFVSLGRGYKWTDKFSVHFDAYMDDWSQYQNNMSTLSCTEGGGWSFWFNEYVYIEMYDSGASAYKSITSNVKYADLTGWNSFDLVYNGTNFKLYLNDELLGTSENMSGPISYNSRNSLLIGVEPGGYEDTYGSSPTTYTGNKFIGKIANVRIEHVDYKLPRDIYTLQVPAQDVDVYALWEPNNSVKVYGTESQWTTGEFKIAKSINDDLINTTWVIDDNPDIYYFGDIKEWTIDFICDGETYNSFSIDETWEDFGLVYSPAWQEYIDVYDYGAQSWVDNKYKTITIVNGDTTNSELIEWLSQNATCTTDISWLPSSTIVRNLNNTDWILNSRLGFSSILTGHGNRDFYMDFVSNNTNFSRMRFTSDQDNVTLQYYLAPNMIDVYTNNPADGHSYWVDENYRLIHITSSEYINTEYWLRENAQMMPKQPQVIKVWNGTSWDIIE